MSKWKIALIALAAVSVALSLLNASWIAPRPEGALVLAAHRGIVQAEEPGAPCGAAALGNADHNFIENTLFSMTHAIRLGARAIAMDVRRSDDGEAVIFRDAELDCRTDGEGPLADRSLAELKRLDMGHGYSADGGATFPLRGRGVAAMPTVEEVVREFPRERLIFNLRGEDPAVADALVAGFAKSGIEIGERHGFHGSPAAIERLRTLTDAGWVLDDEASDDCFADYRTTGWTGMVPESCENITLAVPTDARWTIWGWPYRFLDRMAGAGTQVMMLGEKPEGGSLVGLQRPEQLGEVPRDFKGLVLIEDMWGVGRALAR